MKFLDAVKLANKNTYLIGKSLDNGDIVDDLLIIPINEKELSLFFMYYRQTLCPQKAIEPFINSAVEIVLLFKRDYLLHSNTFTIMSVDKVKQKLRNNK